LHLISPKTDYNSCSLFDQTLMINIASKSGYAKKYTTFGVYTS